MCFTIVDQDLRTNHETGNVQAVLMASNLFIKAIHELGGNKI
jgi:hypothetical protein